MSSCINEFTVNYLFTLCFTFPSFVSPPLSPSLLPILLHQLLLHTYTPTLKILQRRFLEPDQTVTLIFISTASIVEHQPSRPCHYLENLPHSRVIFPRTAFFPELRSTLISIRTSCNLLHFHLTRLLTNIADNRLTRHGEKQVDSSPGC